MKKGKYNLIALGISFLCLFPAIGSSAEKFPIRPIELVSPWGPGGGSDIFSRKIANLAEKTLGQPIPVINAPGASGQTGVNKALAARPDGYTLVQVVSDNVLLDAAGKSSFSYKELAWLARGQLAYSLLFLPTDSKIKDWEELAKIAKENPGKIRIAGSGKGSPDDIIVSFLGVKGYKFTYIPYNNPSERYVSPLRGESEVLFEQIGDIKSMLDAKQYRPIFGFYQKRSADYPQVPTSAEYGIDIALPQWRGIAARKEIPKERLQILADAFKKAMGTEDFKAFTKSTRTDEEPPIFGDEFVKFIEDEYQRTVRLLQETASKK